MATRIKLRRDTAANWLELNPILAQGETGFETDTRMMKLGDGSTRWADLKYAVTGDLQVTNDTIHGDAGVSLSSGIGSRENWVMLTSGKADPDSTQDTYIDGVAYDSQGNAVSMGWYDNTSGCYLQKADASGNVLWNNYYNEYNSYGFGMGVDKNDDIVMILSETDSSSNDIILVKVSGTDGTIIWQKYINSYGDYNDYASCIDIDAQGNIFITGSANNAGPDNNDLAYVAKFSGANGSMIWSKSYDIDAFDSTGTGLKVDKDGNVAVVGSVSWMAGFITVYKINGDTGAIMWQGRVLNAKFNNGNTSSVSGPDIYYGGLQSSDIAVDSQGDFYFTFNTFMDWGELYCVVTKFNGATGASEWSRRVSYGDYDIGVGSVVCDELDNLYVSSTLRRNKDTYDLGSSNRLTQNITKFNSTGSIVWQRWLSNEQANTFDGKKTYQNSPIGQSIAVNKDYILVGGTYIFQDDYDDSNNYWYVQPYTAQLSRDGTEFDIDGWKFVDSQKDTGIEFVAVITDVNNYAYDDASVNNFGVTVNNGDVTGVEGNIDSVALVYLNKTNVNKVTFSEKTLTLPKGGALDVGREKLGHITAIGGGFDGVEGWNGQGDVWLNGNDRDEKGSTYSAGAWFSYNTWNDYTSNTRVPLVFKTDADGKLAWQAGQALNQNNGTNDLVDVVYHQPTNTVIALGNDGELDGHEGFNVMYLDADTGSMKQNITHIRPQEGSNDIYPTTLSVMSDGTPVVSGYITGTSATYANVTADGAGLTGSTNSGTLVIPKSTFTVGDATEYPQEDGTWYLYPEGAQIYSVNRFGHDDAYPTWTYTGTLGSGATLDITILNGVADATAVNVSGTGYKPGQRIKVLGTALGGATPDNDLELYIDVVDGSGAITSFTSAGNFPNAGAGPDGTYTAVATIAMEPVNLLGWVQYAPEGTAYTLFNIDNGGNYFGVGDTIKILGTQLGGATPANDLTITVTAINDRGQNLGGITGVDISGTPQDTNIKLYGGSWDYTVTSSDINVRHELSNDGFIWTPTWSKVFGSPIGTYTYDDFHGLTLDSSDNVIVGGYSENVGLGSNTTAYGSYNQTGVVVKFDSTGTMLWAKSLDGSEGGSTVWGVATDADDNIYSVMVSNNTNGDPYITKQDADGNFVWQQAVNVNNSQAWAIDVADNGDVLVVGECDSWWFNYNYRYYNNNLLVVKFDKDGNKLFSRILWSQNGLRTNKNDNYSNQLTIKGDRFSFAAYSYDPGNYDYCGIVIDLPLDGTGVGDHGQFHYEEVEIRRNYRFEQNNFYGHALVSDVTSNMATRPYTFVDAPYVDGDAWRNVTIYADREAKIETIYKPTGGEIKGVAKIVFEDGTEQTSSSQGLPQVSVPLVNGGANDYWLRPEDNGKHIYQRNDCAVIIPNPNRVDLPVGFAFTIINDGYDSGVVCEDGSDSIYKSGDGGNNYQSFTISSWSMATLVKFRNNRWMIAGTNISNGW